MRIAIQQSAGTSGDVAANLAALRRAAEAAAARGAGLVILPELFVTGYNLGDRLRALAEPLDGPALRTIGATARDTGVAVLTGFCERAGAQLYNSAVLVDRSGAVRLAYRKCHLYGPMEQRLFTPGDALAGTELDGLRIGLLVCYDVEFPEAVRALALAGVDLVAAPTTLMAPFDFVARTLVPTRAWENQLFVAYANRIGREHELSYVGQSCIIGPDGSELARADATSEMLLVADIDPAAIRDWRREQCYLRDRRPELYGAAVHSSAQVVRRQSTSS